MTPPLVTAVIPTYGRARLLRRAIRSVQAQTLPGIQVCVYDNASPDETPTVVAEMKRADPRIIYHRHPQNIGAAANFIYGLERVNTPYFSLLSDDDVLLPTLYEAALTDLEREPEAGFAAFGVLLQLPPWDFLVLDRSMQSCPEGIYRGEDRILAVARHKPPLWTGTVFRRELLQEIGLPQPEVGSAFDFDFQFRAAARRPFILRHRPGAIFVRSSPFIADRAWSHADGFWPGWRKLTSNLLEDARIPAEVRRDLRPLLLDLLAQYLWIVGCSCILRGEYDEARKAAVLLGAELRRKRRSSAIDGLARLCRSIPFLTKFPAAFVYLRALRRRFAEGIADRYAGYRRILEA